MGGDPIIKRQRGALGAAVETMFGPDRPAWLRVVTTAAYFAILGPLIGLLIVLVPLSLFFPYAGGVALHVIPMVFLLFYPVCMAPAAITGAYAALVSPSMPPPAGVSFHVSIFAMGGAATFVCFAAIGLEGGASAAGSAFGFAVIGALSALVCTGMARRWPLARVR